jgi:multidrug efflux system membrane fusion protein
MMTWRGIGIAVVTVAVCGVLGWALLDRPAGADAPAPPSQPRVPVTTTVAARRDMPEYLDGLGTVQALNVVDIKAQVNGTLTALPVREGQEVHRGDIVAEIDPRPYKAALDQAIAQRGEDAAQLKSAQLDLNRYQSLARRGFAPVQQVDDQRATADKETAALAADDAMIETARLNLGYCVIRAPIDGRVGLYQLDVGNLVEMASQTGIVSITQDKPIAVVFTLPESDLSRVRAAQARGAVPVQVNGGDPGKILASGVLLTPNNTIDTTSGTIAMKARFPNADDHLWPGEFVNTRTLVTTLRDAVVIPTQAVQHGPDGLFVYDVKPDGTAAQVSITVGYEDNGLSVVTSGLNGGEAVVVTGQSRLSPGTAVTATDMAHAAPAPAPRT